MWDADNQQYAVAYVVFSSVFGSALGPIVGGFVEQYLAWRWSIWIQLIFGGFVQACHFFLVPETRSTIIMDRVAKKRRKATVDSFLLSRSCPPIHWIGSMVFATLVGIANYAIYMVIVDYMICAYGPYSASATGGNGWSRNFLAGVLTIPATPFFESEGYPHLAYDCLLTSI
ncbi:uncharacterized protein Z518_00911 [Rhinocladiella mackenziei CBS 650.93]|uniref:Major facilitator superfamily (MFS) profile domain-containing protein n=1 Tax=Rhinocladiella mackenziei CBS 650.93 TaxID=1442369 RepID=A0A0D2JK25_9EURO|nr:uncharacterized protein Z518_00911 [Rhinocladiella mackenziei CBS 650.93]KIX09830.1 hypothetical protein Z518_00911 [Rhinocladiella mackenziei CBS 650.93]